MAACVATGAVVPRGDPALNRRSRNCKQPNRQRKHDQEDLTRCALARRQVTSSCLVWQSRRRSTVCRLVLARATTSTLGQRLSGSSDAARHQRKKLVLREEIGRA